MPQHKVTVPIQVSLRPETLERLTHHVKDVSASDVLSSKASLFFEGLADGGLFLTVDQVQKIEQESKKEIANGGDVVTAVGKSSGFQEGANIFPFRIDPSFVPALEIRATESGRTVAELMQEVVDIAIENNWVYGIEMTGTRRTFTKEQEEFLSQFTDMDHFTVRDIIIRVKELLPKASKKKEQHQEVSA